MNVRFLVISFIFAFLSILLPITGLNFPMKSESLITKGFPIAFYSFVDPHYYKGIISLFNIEMVGINLMNFLFNTFVIYVLLFSFYKVLLILNVLSPRKDHKSTN